MTKIETVKHNRYTIRGGVIEGKARAIGCLGYRKIAEAVGDNPQQAIELVKKEIDERDLQRLKQRRAEYIGTVEDYIDAFASAERTKSEDLMLRTHLNAKGHSITATELARAAGYKDYGAANLNYGKLAKKIGDACGLKPRLDIADKAIIYTFMLADGEQEAGQEWRWIMHPEVVQALKSLNF